MFDICPDDQWHNYGTWNEAEGNGEWEGDPPPVHSLSKRIKQKVKCKFCGSFDVMWWSSPIGWRLYNREDNTLHTCKKYKQK